MMDAEVITRALLDLREQYPDDARYEAACERLYELVATGWMAEASRAADVRAADEGGRWVTRDGGQHVWLSDEGTVHPGGPGTPAADRDKGEKKPKEKSGASPAAAKSGDAKSLASLTDKDLKEAKFVRPVKEGDTLNSTYIGTVEVEGKKFFYKGTGEEDAKREALMADLCKTAGLEAPAARHAEISGAPVAHGQRGGVLAEYVEGKTLADHLESDHGYPPLRAGEEDRALLTGFLIGQGDRHEGNYMVRGDRLVSIDHEFSFWDASVKDWEKDRGTTEDPGVKGALDSVHGNCLWGLSDKTNSTSFDADVVRDLATKGQKMAAQLKDANPLAAEVCRRHAGVLQKMANSGDTSYNSLKRHLEEAVK